jgi:predicted PurR-regulated permease PerM
MSQIVTYLSVVVWGLLLGATGALLAVPLTLIVKVIVEMASGSTRISALIVEEVPEEAVAEIPVAADDAPSPEASPA